MFGYSILSALNALVKGTRGLLYPLAAKRVGKHKHTIWDVLIMIVSIVLFGC